MQPLLIDTNLLLLLIVGSASRKYIAEHKRLSGYQEDHFELLVELAGRFSDLVTVPHVLTEVSNLSRQIHKPARLAIYEKLREFVESATEYPVASIEGFRRSEAASLGLTDSVLLHLCESGIALITVDSDLATNAEMLGCTVVRFP